MGGRTGKLLLVLAAVAGAAVLVLAGTAVFLAQRADYGWKPRSAKPTFGASPPRLLFDEAHHNASTAGFSGRYWPFARLVRADGYELERLRTGFEPGSLARGRVLVVANASGAPRPQPFGINVPVATDRKRSDPAFSAAEVSAVRARVETGGGLLLVSDHAPFDQAAAPLAEALGVTMHRGFVEVPGEPSDPLVFSTENGRLGDRRRSASRAPRGERAGRRLRARVGSGCRPRRGGRPDRSGRPRRAVRHEDARQRQRAVGPRPAALAVARAVSSDRGGRPQSRPASGSRPGPATFRLARRRGPEERGEPR